MFLEEFAKAIKIEGDIGVTKVAHGNAMIILKFEASAKDLLDAVKLLLSKFTKDEEQTRKLHQLAYDIAVSNYQFELYAKQATFAANMKAWRAKYQWYNRTNAHTRREQNNCLNGRRETDNKSGWQHDAKLCRVSKELAESWLSFLLRRLEME